MDTYKGRNTNTVPTRANQLQDTQITQITAMRYSESVQDEYINTSRL